jgi:osmotically inducible protein OsmC
MGGEGGGTNPEQLFAVGYAACFESALGAAAELTRAAHQICPYSNATRGNIEVQLTANGAAVDVS